MDESKKYLHDRVVLLLISVNAFVVLITTVAILLRLNGGSGDYFVQYRSNLGLNAYQIGSFVPLLGFIVFALFILAFHTLISYRIFSQRRDVSIVMLGFGTLLLVLTLIVSNALILLRG